ncbi:alpha/beta-hydrolase [Lentinula edodes]|uniref:alpha/beta-hydrolase n=1 Tax=Lentinula edodes TaxID=5353 RepID=UPI001E8EE88C|nr:alpha/beta-hydrolase [Lentinula edodes]KAH7874076.1 alpha/beta-hydrolase [Lentinula edodes]KAJ3901979.1 alpha/beta-hydrolase [Lentinula edodes]
MSLHFTSFLKLVFITTFFVHSTFTFPVLLPFHHHHGTTSTPTTLVNNDFVSSKLLRPALFSRVVYCAKKTVTKWDCGGPCEAIGPDIHVIKWGGNDGLVPSYLIAHDPSTNTIVVAHQGTNSKNVLSILNDVNILHVGLDKSIFKQSAKKVEVHEGFQNTFRHTSTIVLTEVKKALIQYKSQSVLLTGHSLGAAVAVLDAIMLHENLDPSVKQSVVVFGLPRMGNEHWTKFVDSTIGSDFIRVTDRKDPVVDLPPRLLDYYHPAGEIHIEDVDKTGQATKIVACPGQENKHCAEGNSIFKDHTSDHLGPYFNDISFGQDACKMKSS